MEQGEGAYPPMIHRRCEVRPYHDVVAGYLGNAPPKRLFVGQVPRLYRESIAPFGGAKEVFQSSLWEGLHPRRHRLSRQSAPARLPAIQAMLPLCSLCVTSLKLGDILDKSELTGCLRFAIVTWLSTNSDSKRSCRSILPYPNSLDYTLCWACMILSIIPSCECDNVGCEGFFKW